MAKQSSDEGLISVAAAAKLLGVSEVRVRDYITGGRLRAERVGRAYVLRRGDVRAFERREPGRPVAK